MADEIYTLTTTQKINLTEIRRQITELQNRKKIAESVSQEEKDKLYYNLEIKPLEEGIKRLQDELTKYKG